VVAYFKDEAAAQAAFDDLIAHGFSREQLHVSTSNDYGRTSDYVDSEETDARNGGAGTNGRTKSEAHGGGIAGWFRSLFGSDEYDSAAERYSERAKAGGAVVAVETTDETRDRAIEVLSSHDAVDIEDGNADLPAGEAGEIRPAGGANQNPSDFTARGEAFTERGADFNARGADLVVAPSQSTVGPRTPVGNRENRGDEERTIEVVREELEVGKRPVVTGGVRVYSRTVEEPVEEQVRLRQERVVVDRQPADRAASGADQASLRDQTIDVVEMSEEPVIQKRARVVEEVRVGKESTERTETVRETLRHTEVQTEPIRPDAGFGDPRNYDADFQNDFKRRFSSDGGDYNTYKPAYEYGSTMAGDPRFTGKRWEDVEPTVRTEFGRRHPEGSWDRLKDAVRYGWNRVTGK
ncbi:MAG: YsnF/AvaK domain-containing protein, partial [Bryobacteraceae bacterium]